MSTFCFLKDGASDNMDDDRDVDTVGDFKWLESKEILPKDITLSENINLKSIDCGKCRINFISEKDVINIVQTEGDKNSSLLNAEQNNSDLIPAVYEGGLKIWECTFDLLNFLIKENINLNGKRVLDLGCGAGIIGIFSCLSGAQTVFQDYNAEVINSSTIPNIFLNNINFEKCKFYSGDWSSFLQLQKETFSEKFDYIFTSETIYNVNNYKKILEIFQHLLQRNGTIYLAAKFYYFGVGGSISEFEDHLRKTDMFNHSICWECESGVKRAIIKIKQK